MKLFNKVVIVAVGFAVVAAVTMGQSDVKSYTPAKDNYEQMRREMLQREMEATLRAQREAAEEERDRVVIHYHNPPVVNVESNNEQRDDTTKYRVTIVVLGAVIALLLGVIIYHLRKPVR